MSKQVEIARITDRIMSRILFYSGEKLPDNDIDDIEKEVKMIVRDEFITPSYASPKGSACTYSLSDEVLCDEPGI